MSRDAREQLRADAAELWGRTPGHVWEPSRDDPVGTPAANTWAQPHFAEHADWLKRRATEAWSDRSRMRNCAQDSEDLNRIRSGLERQLAHANELHVLVTGTSSIGVDQMTDLNAPIIHDSTGATSMPAANVRDAVRHEATVVALKPQIRLTASGMTDERGAATYLGVAPRTMRRWRDKQTGPAYHILGGRVWYTIEALDHYLEICRRDPLAG